MDQLLRQILTELRGMWRYRWWAVGLAWLTALVGWAIVFTLPNQYEATAKVFVDTDSAVRDFMGGLAVEVDVDTRVAYVRQRLLSRPYLEEVARETDLDLRVGTPREFERLIQQLRADIRIAAQGDSSRRRGRNNFAENLYTIAYRDPERFTAESVVSTLLNAFVDQSLSGTLSEPDSARKFLEEQIALYSGRLTEAERRLAEFKRQNVGMLPGESGGYFNRLQSAIEDRQRLTNELEIAIQRRNALMRQMQGTEPTSADVLTPRGELEQQISQHQTDLDELLLRFTEKHPDVVAKRETIATLQDRLEAMDTMVVDGAASTNPVFQQAQIALNDAEVEIAGLRSQIAVQDRRVTELQDLLDTIPQVEADLQALNRDYEITKANYEELVQRLETAKLSGAVGETGEDVAFRVIDPPTAPSAPVAPQRPMLLVAVLAAALALGAGLTFVLHQLNPVFTSRDQVYDELEVPVLGSVSMAWTPQQQRRQRLAHWSFGLAMMALFSVFLGVFATQETILNMAQQLLA